MVIQFALTDKWRTKTGWLNQVGKDADLIDLTKFWQRLDSGKYARVKLEEMEVAALVF